MTTNQKQVKDWMQAFGQDTPEKPTIPSLEVRKLRAKLILEEALETIEALGLVIEVSKLTEGLTGYKFNTLSYVNFTVANAPNLLEIADGCEDLKVVTEGTLVACGLTNAYDIIRHDGISEEDYEEKIPVKNDPLFDEVMRSNWSKMWTESEIDDTVIATLTVKCLDGKSGRHIVTNESGKVIKSPSYSHANLQPIIDEMSK